MQKQFLIQAKLIFFIALSLVIGCSIKMPPMKMKVEEVQKLIREDGSVLSKDGSIIEGEWTLSFPKDATVTETREFQDNYAELKFSPLVCTHPTRGVSKCALILRFSVDQPQRCLLRGPGIQTPISCPVKAEYRGSAEVKGKTHKVTLKVDITAYRFIPGQKKLMT